MPLTRRQFELGINKDIEEWMRRIHSYLSEHKDQAFTLDEIAEGLGVKKVLGPPSSEVITEGEKRWDLEAALAKLVEIGVVDRGKIRYKDYYALGRKPLELFLESQG